MLKWAIWPRARIGGCALAFAVCAPGLASAGSLQVLQAFNHANGSYPNGELISDAAGDLYGTTAGGGSGGGGTAFKLDARGKETVLFNFGGADNSPSGSAPAAGLVQDGDGNLYGTTSYGGAAADGIVFKLAPDGTETVLYAFQGGNDGAQPEGALLRAANGDLYGATLLGGGSNTCEFYGCGTVYRIAADGTETVLYAFTGGNDGAYPYSTLVADKHGNLYGTACCNGLYNSGVIFEIPAGGGVRVLYSFTGGDDGYEPSSGLYRDGVGNLYGTTWAGGKHGRGVVYMLAPDGRQTVLHAFTKGGDGGFPDGAVIGDAHGDLFGGTCRGGADYGGTVYELTPKGALSTLYDFTGESDGHCPVDRLTRNGGNIYGVTRKGGAHHRGVLFELTK
jgi:uncharacterized repeat protein (TIGR03803 family)